MDKISSAVIELANKHFDNFKIRNGEVVVNECPFCHGGENHDKNTFAIGLYNGAYSCLRGNCNEKGSFKKLCDFFGENANIESPKVVITNTMKSFDKPDAAMLHPLTEEIITYFACRKISEETLKDFGISSDEEGNIVFPFYKDNTLVYVKYRKPQKYTKALGPKEWSMKNTEPILFGMDQVSLNSRLIITEGEIDALSLYEAGIRNVVSVPCGCNYMDWITTCWDWLEHFQQIILFGDSDEPGVQMMQTLTKRLGEDRCMIAPQYPELVADGKHFGRPCKDANEILYAYGPEMLQELIDQCEPAPLEGILDLSSVPFVDPSKVERIYTRIPALDQAIGGFSAGGLTIISGRRGEGKSTVSGTFLLNAVQQDYKVAAFSGELPAHMFLEWIMLQACENKYIEWREDERNGKRYAAVPMEIQERIRNWLREKFFLFDNSFVEEGSMIDSVIKRFSMCARRYGCKIFLVDNLMCLTGGVEEEFRMQTKITSALKQFAMKYNAHVILVAHPRKSKPDQAFNSEDVAGSANITNLADIVMSIEKPNIRVTKNREFGDTPFIECGFDPANRRIFQANIGDRIMYGWNHEGISVPANQACNLDEFAIKYGRTENPF